MLLQMNNTFPISRCVDKSSHQYSALFNYDKSILNYFYSTSSSGNNNTTTNNITNTDEDLGTDDLRVDINVRLKNYQPMTKHENNLLLKSKNSKNSFFISKLLPELFSTSVENKKLKICSSQQKNSEKDVCPSLSRSVSENADSYTPNHDKLKIAALKSQQR